MIATYFEKLNYEDNYVLNYVGDVSNSFSEFILKFNIFKLNFNDHGDIYEKVCSMFISLSKTIYNEANALEMINKCVGKIFTKKSLRIFIENEL